MNSKLFRSANAVNKFFYKNLFVFLMLVTTGNYAQNIYTVAGNGVNGFAGDGGPATSASLYTPLGVATDLSGNVYIVDFQNKRIRKVNAATGLITTVAGNGSTGYNGDGIAATSASLSSPYGVAVDKFGNIYIADSQNNRIRKVTVSTGLISTVAGSGISGYNGDGIAATTAKLNNPKRVAVDTAGNIYISDGYNYRIRKVSIATGLISTIAGTGTPGYNGDGILATTAQLNSPFGIALDASGNIYICDQSNNRLRKVTISTGMISTIAGDGLGGYSSDGVAATSASLNAPAGVTVDASGNVFIADDLNSRIRKVTALTGLISTIAGDGTNGSSPDGTLATAAQVYEPYDVAVDLCGNVYIGAPAYARVRKVVMMTLSVSSTNTSCLESNATASISGGTPPYTYLWSNGSVYATDSAIAAGTYSVTITDSVGCAISSSITISNLPPPPAPSICMVTVDGSSVNNIIYWDKTPYTSADSFIVYREVSTSVYKRIGAVSSDSMSEFVDDVRSVGPANGDPNVGAYRYKLRIRDTCGLLSPLGPYHNTIYIIYAGSGQFTWSIPYTIEGASNPVSNYVLLCDTANVDVWAPVGTVAGTQSSATDPGFSNHSTIANWRVKTSWGIICDPSRATVNTTRSNIRHASGIATSIALINSDPSVFIYPNPAKDEVSLMLSPDIKNADIKIINMMGQTVYENKLQAANGGITLKLDTSGYAKGLYTVSIEKNDTKIFKKLIIN
jgi:sugar lactone lactonase YvrE